MFIHVALRLLQFITNLTCKAVEFNLEFIPNFTSACNSCTAIEYLKIHTNWVDLELDTFSSEELLVLRNSKTLK